MPLKRRAGKSRVHKVTAEAIEAWRAGDYSRLHMALGLRPWEMSPLPEDLTALGVGPEKPGYDDGWSASWAQARELQLLLLKEAPAPTREAE